MKKWITLFVFTITTFTTIQAQQQASFGITGGLLNTNADIKIGALGFDIANIDAINETGFYVGLLADLPLGESFHIQPEATYGKTGDLEFFYVPVLAKYYVTPGLNLQLGPQFNYSSNLGEIKDNLRDIEDIIGTDLNVADMIKSTAFDLAFGLGYDINDKFLVQARYAIPLTDRYDGPLGGSIDIKNTTLQVGLAYKF
ncbi:porin family protein [Aegicerativicinus sediminis]|uniref:porin family protein n=1 Tax=Aegicerativicinus sediminis TaxID=2893202 RepID=UPI001E3E492E|nr:porin family protein [Aegicerativicinus sediminis]